MKHHLLAIINANPVIDALINRRVYWGFAPQGVALPFIVLNAISDVPDYTLDGEGISTARVQLDGYAASFAGAATLEAATRQCLSGFSDPILQGVFVENTTYTSDDEGGTRLHRAMTDLSVKYIFNP